LWELKHVIIKI